jgi:TatA/E family protein of Tat protein translocase
MEGLFAPWHLLIVFVVAVLVFGPAKLPEIGRQIGRGLHELRKFREGFEDDIRGFVGHDDDQPSSSHQEQLPRGGGSDRKPQLPPSGD